MDWIGAITGPLGLVLAIILAVREWRHARRQQAQAISVSAEFVGRDGYLPICRVTCYNTSSAPVYNVHAYINWASVAVNEEDGELVAVENVETLGFYEVGPNAVATHEATFVGEPIRPPNLPVGPFRVHFTFTDANNRRWERRLDGTLNENPFDVLGLQPTGQYGPIPPLDLYEAPSGWRRWLLLRHDLAGAMPDDTRAHDARDD